eukprot:s1143_g18.t1
MQRQIFQGRVGLFSSGESFLHPLADVLSMANLQKSQSLEQLLSADYWRQLCPQLHVEDKNYQDRLLQKAPKGPTAADAALTDACREVRAGILEEGFASLQPSQVHWSVQVSQLAEGIFELERQGWPPTFIAMYDEAWVMAKDAQEIMRLATGNSLCMDVVAFLVRPTQTKGFSPHRDRQPEDWVPKGAAAETSSTFKADGMAKYVTLWAALTDATPENSCLHFVPRSVDPGYSAGDPEDGDPLQRVFQDKAAYQKIRSVPVPAGGCTFHTHRTIHWGSAGRNCKSVPPRVALSFGFSTEDFEPPYFSPKVLPFPDLKLRAALVSAQVINYSTLAVGDREGWTALAGGMAGCNASKLRLLHRVFQSQVKRFHPTYRKEIATKFVSVSLNISRDDGADGAGENAMPKQKRKKKRTKVTLATAAQDSDEDDEALMTMLETEAATGEVLFHDDFDLLNGGKDEQIDRVAKPAKKLRRKKRTQG